MTMTYCWRYGRVVPMLDEAEWAQIEPLPPDSKSSISMLIRSGHSVEDAKSLVFQPIKEKFAELTGVDDGPNT